MAPVSCDALSSSDRAVCNWLRASSLSCACMCLVISNANTILSVRCTKRVETQQLRFKRSAHASHLWGHSTISRLLKASAIRFTSFLRIPPPPAPPALLPPALNCRESCHFAPIVRSDAALCGHGKWKSEFAKSTAAAIDYVCAAQTTFTLKSTLTPPPNHLLVFNITVASTFSRPTLRLTSPRARFAQRGILLRLSGKILCLVPDAFCRSRRQPNSSR